MTAGKTPQNNTTQETVSTGNALGTTSDTTNSSGKHAALVALGQQIRKVRTKRGISQEDFAAKAGLGRSYYGGIERGERNVAALNLMRIAVALEVETGELFPDTKAFEPLLGGASADDQ